MSITTDLTATPIPEKASAWYTATLKDRVGTAIPAASLSTLTLTFYDLAVPATFINSRNQQNVLNTNNVTLDSSGNLVWTLQVADTTLGSQSNVMEYRVALFEWYGASVGYGKHEVLLAVQNLTNVT